MLRKFILLLLCVMLGACTQQGSSGQVTSITTETPIVPTNPQEIIPPDEVKESFPKLDIVYNRDTYSHTFYLQQYEFYYLTNGNLRHIIADFHIDVNGQLDDLDYKTFEVTILTQDNVTLKVSYDEAKQEFYDASEGALEKDVMNFNNSMRRTLLSECGLIKSVLEETLNTVVAGSSPDQKRVERTYAGKTLNSKIFDVSRSYRNDGGYHPSESIDEDMYSVFTLNFEYSEDQALSNVGHMLYAIDRSIESPSDFYKSDSFIPDILRISDSYGCITGGCEVEDNAIVQIHYGVDGYMTIFTIQQYKQAIKDVLGIESTYTLETGNNEYGYYEDADMGIIIAYPYAGDRVQIPYGLYVLDQEQNDDVLTLVYKKYDLRDSVTLEEGFNYTTEDYVERFTDIVMTYPTWTATLKYNAEKDVYQILSVKIMENE